jgi:hypothetical protein
LTRLGCLFLRTLSPPPSSQGATSLNKPSSNSSPPSDSEGRRNFIQPRPPVTDMPQEREAAGQYSRWLCDHTNAFSTRTKYSDFLTSFSGVTSCLGIHAITTQPSERKSFHFPSFSEEI